MASPFLRASEEAAAPAVRWNIAALAHDWTAHLRVARRILKCRALAEDVVQDVMLRLVAEPPEGVEGVPAAYVSRMVRNHDGPAPPPQ